MISTLVVVEARIRVVDELFGGFVSVDWHRTHARSHDQAIGIFGLSEHRLYSGGR